MPIEKLSERLQASEFLLSTTAYLWAWRIKHEYPTALRNAAEAWAAGEELPPVEISGVTLESVREQTRLSPPNAMELMYVLSRSYADGMAMLLDFQSL